MFNEQNTLHNMSKRNIALVEKNNWNSACPNCVMATLHSDSIVSHSCFCIMPIIIYTAVYSCSVYAILYLQ